MTFLLINERTKDLKPYSVQYFLFLTLVVPPPLNVHYRLGDPKYSVEECRVRGVTFACPVRAALRLIVWEKETESDVKHIRDIKEQDIYLGELPLMTPTGSFIINGTERVIVSQMHKSPGVVFTHDKGKSNSSGKIIYSA